MLSREQWGLKSGTADDKEYCGRCWFKFGEAVEMIPCTPETCDD